MLIKIVNLWCHLAALGHFSENEHFDIIKPKSSKRNFYPEVNGVWIHWVEELQGRET